LELSEKLKKAPARTKCCAKSGHNLKERGSEFLTFGWRNFWLNAAIEIARSQNWARESRQRP
jgi:hypothetical protein